MTDALDHLFGPTPARAGVAYSMSPVLEPVAEHGISGPTAQRLRVALATIAERAVDMKRPFLVSDVRANREGIAEAGEIAAVGCTAALAVPILFRRQLLGIFVLLFPAHGLPDDETQLFVETVATLVAPALDREHRADAAPPRGDPNANGGATGAALLGVSVGHELEGPVSALSLQLEEQRRLLAELRMFAEESDTALGGTLAELEELTDEMSAAAQRLRDTTNQLTQLGPRERLPEALDVSDLAREVCAVARPNLEARGILLETQLAPGGFVSGHRDLLLQVLGDVLNLAADLASHAVGPPRVSVRTIVEATRMTLVIDDVGPELDEKTFEQIDRAPFTGFSSERRRLVLKLTGDVASSIGGHLEVVPRPTGGTSYRLVLPILGAISSNPALQAPSDSIPPAQVQRRVLVVDDDPVFTRSARRALRPHDVREAQTASEAEIILGDPTYLPDLVICDLMLPGADGTTLHQRIAERRPDVARRFLFVTGGTLSKTTADYIRDSGCGALRKPIDLSEVKRQLFNPRRESVTTAIVQTLRRDNS